MADVNQFLDQLSADVNTTYVPRVQSFVNTLGGQVAADVGPKFGQFIQKLITDVFAQQSGPVQAFVGKLIQDVAGHYHPELSGNLAARIVDNGLEIESNDTRLLVKDRATGQAIATLDLPVFVRINFNDLFLKIESGTVKIKDPQIG